MQGLNFNDLGERSNIYFLWSIIYSAHNLLNLSTKEYYLGSKINLISKIIKSIKFSQSKERVIFF